MLITKEEIIKKIESIPPMPESVKNTIEFLKVGELQKAADAAEKDIVLKQKISKIVNSAYFGFSKELTDIRQMFSALGLEMAKSVVLSYMVSLLEPKEWKIFIDLNFEEFQSAFLAGSKEAVIIESDKATYKKYADALSLIPATICLIDELLGDKKREVNLLIESSGLNYATILKRFTGYSIFTLAAFVAKKWELDEENVNFVKLIECEKCEGEAVTIAAAVHLELFKIVSKPQFFILNSFVTFNPKSIEIAVKNYERMMNEE
jgi:HD-like signal output (HDOD) protein